MDGLVNRFAVAKATAHGLFYSIFKIHHLPAAILIVLQSVSASAQGSGTGTGGGHPDPIYGNPSASYLTYEARLPRNDIPSIVTIWLSLFNGITKQDQACAELASLMSSPLVPKTVKDNAFSYARSNLDNMCKKIADRIPAETDVISYDPYCVRVTTWSGKGKEIPKDPGDFKKWCESLPEFSTNGWWPPDGPKLEVNFKLPMEEDAFCDFTAHSRISCADFSDERPGPVRLPKLFTDTLQSETHEIGGGL